MVKTKAFSLTELMVVVAIAAFIAAVAVPNYKAYLNKAKITNMISTIEPCKIQVYQTFLQTGAFPPTVSCYSKTLTNSLSSTPLKEGIYAAYKVQGNYVEFTLQSDIKAESGDKANLYIRLTNSSDDGDLTYSCGILGNPNPIPKKYLPAGCNTP